MAYMECLGVETVFCFVYRTQEWFTTVFSDKALRDCCHWRLVEKHRKPTPGELKRVRMFEVAAIDFMVHYLYLMSEIDT